MPFFSYHFQTTFLLVSCMNIITNFEYKCPPLPPDHEGVGQGVFIWCFPMLLQFSATKWWQFGEKAYILKSYGKESLRVTLQVSEQSSVQKRENVRKFTRWHVLEWNVWENYVVAWKHWKREKKIKTNGKTRNVFEHLKLRNLRLLLYLSIGLFPYAHKNCFPPSLKSVQICIILLQKNENKVNR